MEIKKIDHIVITSSRIDEMIRFYRMIGFYIVDQGDRIEMFSGDFKINMHILDHELSPHASYVMPGSADLCFEVKDSMSDIIDELNRYKIEIDFGPIHRQGTYGTMESLYVYDPEGNLIEFCSYEKERQSF